MKKIAIPLIFIFLFFGCKSNKNQADDSNTKRAPNETCNMKITKAPFVVQNATYQIWYGGQRGVQGIKIKIGGKDVKRNVEFKNIYFHKKEGELNIVFNDVNIVLKGNINTSDREEMKLNANPNEEFGNEPPTKPKYPNLKENEAMISYFHNGSKKVFKINLLEKAAIYYP